MSEKRITRAGELGRQTLGPLPEGWAIVGGFINYNADAYCKYILDKSGRLDRNSIALTLENYGYADHARRWFLSPVEMVAGELLEACRYTLNNLEAAERERLITAPRHFQAQLGESVKMLRAAVEKAAGVQP